MRDRCFSPGFAREDGSLGSCWVWEMGDLLLISCPPYTASCLFKMKDLVLLWMLSFSNSDTLSLQRALKSLSLLFHHLLVGQIGTTSPSTDEETESRRPHTGERQVVKLLFLLS